MNKGICDYDTWLFLYTDLVDEIYTRIIQELKMKCEIPLHHNIDFCLRNSFYDNLSYYLYKTSTNKYKHTQFYKDAMNRIKNKWTD